jgi:hypothetical protein
MDSVTPTLNCEGAVTLGCGVRPDDAGIRDSQNLTLEELSLRGEALRGRAERIAVALKSEVVCVAEPSPGNGGFTVLDGAGHGSSLVDTENGYV